MKKTIFCIFLLNFLFASDFNSNLLSSIKKAGIKGSIKILQVQKIHSLNDINLVKLSIDNKVQNLFLVNSDGSSFTTFPAMIQLSDENDEKNVIAMVQNLQDEQNKIAQQEVLKILKTIDDSRFLTIQSFYKDNKKTIYIISDPECPYCRKDMDKIVKWLRNAHVKILFAPVHGKSAYTKSALMLQESKKFKPSNQDELIKILQKYYDEKKVVKDSDVTDKQRDEILQNSKLVFSKGIIKGVPFHVEVENE